MLECPFRNLFSVLFFNCLGFCLSSLSSTSVAHTLCAGWCPHDESDCLTDDPVLSGSFTKIKVVVYTGGWNWLRIVLVLVVMYYVLCNGLWSAVFRMY